MKHYSYLKLYGDLLSELLYSVIMILCFNIFTWSFISYWREII